MIRLVLAALITFVGVTFCVANTHHVALRLPLTQPVQVRLIFLLATTFVGALLFSAFLVLVQRARDKFRRAPSIAVEPQRARYADIHVESEMDQQPTLPADVAPPHNPCGPDQTPQTGLLERLRRGRNGQHANAPH